MHHHKYVHVNTQIRIHFAMSENVGPNLAMPVCRLNGYIRYEFPTSLFARKHTFIFQTKLAK